MKYVSKLKHPGTIVHPRLGRVQLGLLSQNELKRLYDSGCAYVALEPGDPPVELVPEVTKTPAKKERNIKKKEPLPDQSDWADKNDEESPI